MIDPETRRDISCRYDAAADAGGLRLREYRALHSPSSSSCSLEHVIVSESWHHSHFAPIHITVPEVYATLTSQEIHPAKICAESMMEAMDIDQVPVSLLNPLK